MNHNTDLIKGLRDLADFLEAHDVPKVNDASLFVFGADLPTIARRPMSCRGRRFWC